MFVGCILELMSFLAWMVILQTLTPFYFEAMGHLKQQLPLLSRFPRREEDIPLIYPMQIHTPCIKNIGKQKDKNIQDLHESASHHASLGNASLYSKYI